MRRLESRCVMGIHVTNLSEEKIKEIGYEIGDSYFDHIYGEGPDGKQEYGLAKFIHTRAMMRNYMVAIVRAGYESDCLYSISEKGEGYIIVTTPKKNLKIGAMFRFMGGIIKAMGFKNAVEMMKVLSGGDVPYEKELKKKKIKYAKLEMLVVTNEYKNQGYMRKLMEMFYELAGDLPCFIDTDATNKMEKYVHLGMKLARMRKLDEGIYMYDLYRDK